MFGLMKQGQGAPEHLPDRFGRLHYCGVCKAMGAVYGPSARLMLNHDTVFLAELFTLIQGKADTVNEWTGGLRSINCLRVPGEEKIPGALLFAADVNVLLGCIKIRDNREDGSRLWGLADKWYGKFGEKARERLIKRGIDIGEIEQSLLELNHLESSFPNEKMTSAHALQRIAAPVARLTAAIFEGMDQVGKPDRTALKDLGSALGRMVYWLDAWQDREADQLKAEFNILNDAPVPISEEVLFRELWREAARFRWALAALGLNREEVDYFALRLEANLPGEKPACSLKQEKHKIPFKARRNFVRSLSEKWSASGFADGLPKWKTALGFGTAASIAVVAPALIESLGHLFRDFSPDWADSIGETAQQSDFIPQMRNGQCCKNCNNGDCCSDDCENTCENAVILFMVLAVVVTLGLIVGIIFIIRAAIGSSKRSAVKHAAKGPVMQQGPPEFKFRKVVEHPKMGISGIETVVRVWMEKVKLDAPVSVTRNDPDRKVLVVNSEIPFTAKIQESPVHLGTISFHLEIHIIDEKVALVFDNFEHHASADVPDGGSLDRIEPVGKNKVLTSKTWDRIKHMTAEKINGFMAAYPPENDSQV